MCFCEQCVKPDTDLLVVNSENTCFVNLPAPSVRHGAPYLSSNKMQNTFQSKPKIRKAVLIPATNNSDRDIAADQLIDF